MSVSLGINRKRRCRTLSWLKNKYLLTYKSWRGMMNRPLSDKDYEGLNVCERWYSFLNFLRDMGLRPSVDYSIARIDHKAGYYLGNCRWEMRGENSKESRLRNESKINSQENNAKKKYRMLKAKLWKCSCGKRNYRLICSGCGGRR